MPFADYKDFADCVAKNRDKDDPEAYCAVIKEKAEGRAAEFRHLSLRVAGKARKQIFNGREHFVVPVVALMEGVIHAVNAQTPELVPFSTLSANVDQWNGRPLMLGHPTKDGVHIAANTPSVLEGQCFGSIFNARVDPVKRRLLVDAYVDPERLRKLERLDVLERVEKGQVIEVSVGAFVGTDPTPGTFNGKPYKASWKMLGSDHLAFLPDSRGACSVEMGCGAHRAATANVLRAEESEIMITIDGRRIANAVLGKRIASAVLTALGRKGSGNFSHAGRPGKVGGSAPDNEESTRKPADPDEVEAQGMTQTEREAILTEKLDEDLDAIETDDPKKRYEREDELVRQYDQDILDMRAKYGYPDLEDEINSASAPDIFAPDPERHMPPDDDPNHGEGPDSDSDAQNRFEIELEDKGATSKFIMEQTQKLGGWKAFKAKYESGAFDKEITEMREKKAAVRKDILKRRLEAYKDCPMCQGSGSHGGNPCEACDGTGELKVAEQGDTDMDRKQLIDRLTSCACSGFTKADGRMLEAASDERLLAFVAATKAKEEEEAEEEKKKKEYQALEEKVTLLQAELRAAGEKQLSEEEYLRRAPDSIRTLVADKKVQDDAERVSLVAGLKVAAANVYTDEELVKMDLPGLRKLAALAKTDIDYSGRGIPIHRSLADNSKDYTPPNPYERGIKALQQGNAH